MKKYNKGRSHTYWLNKWREDKTTIVTANRLNQLHVVKFCLNCLRTDCQYPGARGTDHIACR